MFNTERSFQRQQLGTPKPEKQYTVKQMNDLLTKLDTIANNVDTMKVESIAKLDQGIRVNAQQINLTSRA